MVFSNFTGVGGYYNTEYVGFVETFFPQTPSHPNIAFRKLQNDLGTPNMTMYKKIGKKSRCIFGRDSPNSL